MIKFVNLTPTKVNIFGKDKKLILSVEPENVSANCTQKKVICGYVGEIPVYRVVFGQVFSVPMPKENTIYIVSHDVAITAKRPDVYCLGSEIRDKQGYMIGYEGISTY